MKRRKPNNWNWWIVGIGSIIVTTGSAIGLYEAGKDRGRREVLEKVLSDNQQHKGR